VYGVLINVKGKSFFVKSLIVLLLYQKKIAISIKKTKNVYLLRVFAKLSNIDFQKNLKSTGYCVIMSLFLKGELVLFRRIWIKCLIFTIILTKRDRAKKKIMKIVTWNLRCVWMFGDGVNSFIHRAGMIYQKIESEKPDVIAFQEVVKESLDYLVKLFPEYEFFGSLRSEDYAYEGLYTAYRKDKFALLRSDIFWLSPEPYKAGSRFEEQSIYPRICVVTELRNKQNNEIFRL
jgi:hypothetical protein